MKTTPFLILFALTVAFGGNTFKERRAVDLRQKDLLVQQRQLPSVDYAKAMTHQVTTGPWDGIEIGTTDYDYAINSGFARRIATYDEGNKVHMVYPHRDVSLSSPQDRLTNVYVYWDASAPTMLVSATPRPKTIGSTGFAGIDVLSAGAGAGIAIMTYTSDGKTYFAIDGGPGFAAFTESEMPAAISDKKIFDPQVTSTPDGSTIWFSANLNFDDVIVARSVDYGASWIGIDSLKKYLPHTGFTINGTAPLLISSDGTLYRIATLTGKGSLPPLGTAHPDSADCIGYFSSTNSGTSWNWTTIDRDGEPLVPSTGDTVYVLLENFSQFSGAVDTTNTLHVVTNGYCIKKVNDSTVSNRFYTLYRNSVNPDWKIISHRQSGEHPEYDSSYYNYSGNAFGFPYPSISVSENGMRVIAIWSQPVFTLNQLDLQDGRIQYSLWFASSYSGGESWYNVLNSFITGLYVNSSGRVYGTTVTDEFPILYLSDTSRGTSISDGTAPIQVPWIYRELILNIESVRDNNLVNTFSLSQNYPNPFNPTTTIHFKLDRDADVSIDVYDMLGRHVTSLIHEYKRAGRHTAAFDGSRLSSGTYYYKMTAGNFTAVKKMVLMK